MGNLIGAKVHTFEEGDEPTIDEMKRAMVLQREFNTLLYEVSIDKIEDRAQADWAEADVVVAISGDDIVLDFRVVRISVDNEPVVWFGTQIDRDDDSSDGYFGWVREIATWVHSVEGMEHWVWFHIHPEGMSQLSLADEKKVTLLNAADLLTVGHLGGPRTFGSFVVVQRNGIVAAVSDDVNGIGPKEDALTSRLYAESYARVLGVDSPMYLAMDAVASAIENFAESWDGNPLKMMMFGIGELIPLQTKLDEARRSLDLSHDEFGRRLREDYAVNGPIDTNVARPARPTLGQIETVTGNLPELPPGILADLADFNFDALN